MNGQIRVLGSIDREDTALWSIVVAVQDDGTPSRSDVALALITVLDANDNPPVFPTDSLNVSFSETSLLNTEVVQVQAVDNFDVGEHQRINYRILETVPFAIVSDTGSIYLNGSIDYETITYYEFTVVAYDFGAVSLSDTLDVRVNLINENDNTPQFNSSVYRINIPENATIGTPLFISIFATDPDSTLADPVTLTYFITDGALNSFVIDPDTAVVAVSAELDRETIPSYTISLAVRDSSRTGIATLQITIDDINEDGPVFNATVYNGFVLENATIGTPVIGIEALDQEFSLPVSFILNGNDGAFELVPNSGTTAQLIVNGSLDRETRDVYELSVTAIDDGNQRSVRNIRIDLIDVNDNAPVFIENPTETNTVTFESTCTSPNSSLSCYRIQIQETADPSSFLTVATTDIDIGANGQSNYYLTSHNDSMFRIIPETGQLFNDLPFNHEEEQLHVLTVTARNVGLPQLTAATLVVVEVLDSNDNKPEFNLTLFEFSVFETDSSDPFDPINKFVGIAAASDADDGRNGDVSYAFISGNIGDAFVISESGEITVRGTIDRDTLFNPTFNLILQATDGNQANQQTGATNVDITVLDVNDNTPMFQAPSLSVSIMEEIQVGTVISGGSFNTRAVDPDFGANGTIYYSITPNIYFNVSSNGDIYTVYRLDFDEDTNVSFLCRTCNTNK